MKKSIVIIMAISGLSGILMLTSGCDTKPATAAKSVNVIPGPAPKAAKIEKKVKAKKTEKIVKVTDINGSKITYSLGKGKKEEVNASSFPGSLKVGDVVTVTNDNGLVNIARYRGLKIPIGC